MNKNKEVIIICSIIALFILEIGIILTTLAGLTSFSILLLIIFIIAIICLIKYVIKKDAIDKQNDSPLVDIENTIMLKLEDLKSESITPIRNEKQIEIVNDNSIKEEIKIQRENNITKEVIEDELGKTIFINDLKEKIKLYEQEQEKIRIQEEEKELRELNDLIEKNRKSRVKNEE